MRGALDPVPQAPMDGTPVVQEVDENESAPPSQEAPTRCLSGMGAGVQRSASCPSTAPGYAGGVNCGSTSET